jgi:hypothetical protein
VPAVIGLPLPLVPGARLELQGTCNRCGQCCTAERNGRLHICEHLLAKIEGGRVKRLGMPEASLCAIYEQRHAGMPPITVTMKDERGIGRFQAQCFKDTWQEDYVIADRGIGKGCSLTMPVTEGRLVAFTPDRRA